jgi:signal transduction histidine kinase/phage shock protein PspC (stress-responsive transcriptional regulator)
MPRTVHGGLGSSPVSPREAMARNDNTTGSDTALRSRGPFRVDLGVRRSRTNKILAGVAGGIGERFAIDPFVVRLAFVVLATAGGAGIVAYIVLWAASNESAMEDAASFPARKPSLRQSIAVGFIVLGLLLLLRSAGLWFADALSWPVAAAAIGSSIIWARSAEDERARWRDVTSRWPADPLQTVFTERVSPLRIIAGGVLIAGGMATFLAANDALLAVRDVAVAIAVTVIGLGLILGPWMWRLARQAVDERRERIRTQERADMAAHLHDSVLQTLALIQRSQSTREMVALARGQERELRSWLYGRNTQSSNGHLRAAIDDEAARVEGQYGVRVEVVVVGDCPLDEPAWALAQACAEAITNAAKHSGTSAISVYVEVEDDALSAFVRDTGAGFTPSEVPADRAGISGSIVGRVERYGGRATIKSERGSGTEVRLRIPRRTP